MRLNMPRRKRGWIDRACYHVTQRCHGRKFLFHFFKYREFYEKQLYETQRRYSVDILNYTITSNHVHLIITADNGEDISKALRYLNGRMGQYYNMEKEKEGAFWGDRFHATRIQNGAHLGKCFFYIDLNMVRAGVVKHPEEWKHCGYHELIMDKSRYRIVNIQRVLESLCMKDKEQFRAWYTKTLNSKLEKEELKREAFWSKAAVVGDSDWLKDTGGKESGMKRYSILSEDGVSFIMGIKTHDKLKRA